MKKTVISFILLSSLLFAELKNIVVSQEFLDKNIPIIDIRTPGEWKETGIIKGSSTIMFFNEQGAYNVEGFLSKLNKAVDTKKEFAIICRTGSRTSMVGRFLANDLKYPVINLQGGMMHLIQNGYKPVIYQP